MAEKVARRGRPAKKFAPIEKVTLLQKVAETGRVPENVSPYLFFKMFPVADGWVNVEKAENPKGKYRSVTKYVLGARAKKYISNTRSDLRKRGIEI